MAIGKPILEGSSQGQKRSTTQIPTRSDPKIRGQEPKTLSKRAHTPVERGWADKADSRPPLRGPGWLGGDWYVWHAPDGPRARAATALGCVQAGAKKLGVIEASYASAIIGVLSPVSSHCFSSCRHGLRWGVEKLECFNSLAIALNSLSESFLAYRGSIILLEAEGRSARPLRWLSRIARRSWFLHSPGSSERPVRSPWA